MVFCPELGLFCDPGIPGKFMFHITPPFFRSNRGEGRGDTASPLGSPIREGGGVVTLTKKLRY